MKFKKKKKLFEECKLLAIVDENKQIILKMVEFCLQKFSRVGIKILYFCRVRDGELSITRRFEISGFLDMGERACGMYKSDSQLN